MKMKTSNYSVVNDYDNDMIYIVDNDNISFEQPLYKALRLTSTSLNPHEDADDYSMWNSQNGADDMRRAGAEIFGDNFLGIQFELESPAIDEDDDRVYLWNTEELGLADKEDEILNFMYEWEKKNACYTLADYIVWYDGSNYKVIMLNEDLATTSGSMEVYDPFEAHPYLDALKDAHFEKCAWNHGHETAYNAGYEFEIPEGSYHFEFCTARKMDEDERLETAQAAFDLESIETTADGNGYPSYLKNALVGFSSLDEVLECANLYGLKTEVFHKRDGWQLWQRLDMMADADAMQIIRDGAPENADGVSCDEGLTRISCDTHTWVAGVVCGRID